MNFTIIPYDSVGSLKLGMTSQEIQENMNQVPKKLKRRSEANLETDVYEKFFVYYKIPGVCEAIEFNNKAEIMFNGIKLFELPYSKLKEYFTSLDDALKLDGSGLTSYKYGIGIYAPFAESEPEEKPEGIIVFEKGYYD